MPGKFVFFGRAEGAFGIKVLGQNLIFQSVHTYLLYRQTHAHTTPPGSPSPLTHTHTRARARTGGMGGDGGGGGKKSFMPISPYRNIAPSFCL